MLFDAERRNTIAAQLVYVLSTIDHPVYPAIQPILRIGFRPGLLVVLAEEGVITLVVTLHGRRMCSVRTFDHRTDQKTRNHSAVGIAGDDLRVHDLFRHYDDVFRRTH